MCFEPQFTHIGFAEDLMAFSGADLRLIRIINEALEEFKCLSGLCVTLLRVNCFFSGVQPHPLKNRILELIDFKEGHILVRSQDCKPLLDKIKGRISSWTCLARQEWMSLLVNEPSFVKYWTFKLGLTLKLKCSSLAWVWTKPTKPCLRLSLSDNLNQLVLTWFISQVELELNIKLLSLRSNTSTYQAFLSRPIVHEPVHEPFVFCLDSTCLLNKPKIKAKFGSFINKEIWTIFVLSQTELFMNSLVHLQS